MTLALDNGGVFFILGGFCLVLWVFLINTFSVVRLCLVARTMETISAWKLFLHGIHFLQTTGLEFAS